MQIYLTYYPGDEWDAAQFFVLEDVVEEYLERRSKDHIPQVFLVVGDEAEHVTNAIKEAAATRLCDREQWESPDDAPEWLRDTDSFSDWCDHFNSIAAYGSANEQASRDYYASR